MLAMIGVPVLLLLLFAWQLVSPLLRTEIAVREPTSIARVVVEPDTNGTRIDFVVVDRMGQETTADGDLRVKLREPDGAVWQTSRPLSSSDFGPIPAGGLLAGRLGYSVTVPAGDWSRPPRHGGAASVTVTIQPSNGSSTISTLEETRFP